MLRLEDASRLLKLQTLFVAPSGPSHSAPSVLELRPFGLLELLSERQSSLAPGGARAPSPCGELALRVSWRDAALEQEKK